MMQRFLQLSDFKLVVGFHGSQNFSLIWKLCSSGDCLVSEALNRSVFLAPLQAIGFI